LRFDCPRIREAFLKIGKSPPEPKGTIDTLPLLTQKFGRRAGNMKMATLAAYFGLGKQSHRSLDDVRMNLEVLKYCATVLFLESTASELSNDNSTDISSPLPNPNLNFMSDSTFVDRVTSVICDIGESNNLAADMETSLTPLIEKMAITFEEASVDCDGNLEPNMPEMLPCSSRTVQHHYSTSLDYLNPSLVLKSNIKATIFSANEHGFRMSLLYNEIPLQLCCIGLKVQFGISTKFVDHTGKPKLSIVLGASESLCQVLYACETVAQKSLIHFGSTSDWRPLIKKSSFSGSSIVRLNIPTSVNRDITTCLVEIYQKESSGNAKKLDLSKSNVDMLKSLFVPGNVLDAYFCVEVYDYQQYSGIRLVAKRLVIHHI